MSQIRQDPRFPNAKYQPINIAESSLLLAQSIQHTIISRTKKYITYKIASHLWNDTSPVEYDGLVVTVYGTAYHISR